MAGHTAFIQFDTCKCGKKGFKKESDRTKFMLQQRQKTEPADSVECPIGDCWHVFNPVLRGDKEAFTKWLVETARPQRPFAPPTTRTGSDSPFASVVLPKPVPSAAVQLPQTPGHPVEDQGVAPALPTQHVTSVHTHCSKVGYATEQIANEMLAKTRGKEKRAYQCRECKDWHLTSMTGNPEDGPIVQEDFMSFPQGGERIQMSVGRYENREIANVTLSYRSELVKVYAKNLPLLRQALSILDNLSRETAEDASVTPAPAGPLSVDDVVGFVTKRPEGVGRRDLVAAFGVSIERLRRPLSEAKTRGLILAKGERGACRYFPVNGGR